MKYKLDNYPGKEKIIYSERLKTEIRKSEETRIMLSNILPKIREAKKQFDRWPKFSRKNLRRVITR